MDLRHPSAVVTGCLLGLASTPACEAIVGIEDRVVSTTSYDAGTSTASGGSTGTGGSAGAGGSTGTGGAAGGGGAPAPCTDGPYGIEGFYFGAPVLEPTFNVDPDPAWCPSNGPVNGGGHVSPDGLRFIQNRGGTGDPACCGGCFRQVEFVRSSLDDDWSTAIAVKFLQSYWVGQWIFLDNLGLMGCHGGDMSCAFYARQSAAQGWPYGYGPDPDHFAFNTLPAFSGTAADQEFAPTPDGRWIVFASNRVSAVDDSAVGGPAAQDLWLGAAVDTPASGPIDPTKGYEALQHLTTASSPDFADMPAWISDDARTIVFSTRRLPDDGFDLHVTTRSDAASSFGPAVKLSAASVDGADEDSFSMPSVATLAAHGGRGFATFRRTVVAPAFTFYRMPVCLGSPDP